MTVLETLYFMMGKWERNNSMHFYVYYYYFQTCPENKQAAISFPSLITVTNIKIFKNQTFWQLVTLNGGSCIHICQGCTSLYYFVNFVDCFLLFQLGLEIRSFEFGEMTASHKLKRPLDKLFWKQFLDFFRNFFPETHSILVL